MNKNELVSVMVKDSGSVKTNAFKFINTMIDIITNELKKKDGKVTLVGLGTFKAVTKKAKTGRNPKTGAKIQIPQRRAPKFIAGKDLKEIVNK